MKNFIYYTVLIILILLSLQLSGLMTVHVTIEETTFNVVSLLINLLPTIILGFIAIYQSKRNIDLAEKSLYYNQIAFTPFITFLDESKVLFTYDSDNDWLENVYMADHVIVYDSGYSFGDNESLIPIGMIFQIKNISDSAIRRFSISSIKMMFKSNVMPFIMPNISSVKTESSCMLLPQQTKNLLIRLHLDKEMGFDYAQIELDMKIIILDYLGNEYKQFVRIKTSKIAQFDRPCDYQLDISEVLQFDRNR